VEKTKVLETVRALEMENVLLEMEVTISMHRPVYVNILSS